MPAQALWIPITWRKGYSPLKTSRLARLNRVRKGWTWPDLEVEEADRDEGWQPPSTNNSSRVEESGIIERTAERLLEDAGKIAKRMDNLEERVGGGETRKSGIETGMKSCSKSGYARTGALVRRHLSWSKACWHEDVHRNAKNTLPFLSTLIGKEEVNRRLSFRPLCLYY